jgi:hypothetical protein
MQSLMGSLINPVGWHEWSGNLSLSTLYYVEYNNTGPGSDTAGRVTLPGYHVINDVVNATVFTVSNFLLGEKNQKVFFFLRNFVLSCLLYLIFLNDMSTHCWKL